MTEVTVNWDGDGGPYVIVPSGYAASLAEYLTRIGVQFRRVPDAIKVMTNDDVIDELTSFLELRSDEALDRNEVTAAVANWARSIGGGPQQYQTSATQIGVQLP